MRQQIEARLNLAIMISLGHGDGLHERHGLRNQKITLFYPIHGYHLAFYGYLSKKPARDQVVTSDSTRGDTLSHKNKVNGQPLPQITQSVVFPPGNAT
jgi:hypothetical protein